MPYSLQFYGPYFIHEGYMPGHPDSHGCVRLHYEDARLLFDRMRIGDPVLVKKAGSARSAKPLAHLFPVF
jgi:lipoprotein-anchoring transpeptidase ErfK/SrfK